MVVEKPTFSCAKIFPRNFVPPRTPELRHDHGHFDINLERHPVLISNMPLYHLATPSARSLSIFETCIFCQSRQLAGFARNKTGRRLLKHLGYPTRVTISNSQRQSYTSPAVQRLDVRRLRADVDERGRLGFYTLTKKQGALHMEAATANSIVKEFLHRQKSMDHKSNVEQLASRKSHPNQSCARPR
jgi:hypothetical protein